MSKIKKTRLKIALGLIIVFLSITFYCLIFKGEAYIGLIERCIAALMVIAPSYILGDSYRKSSSPNER